MVRVTDSLDPEDYTVLAQDRANGLFQGTTVPHGKLMNDLKDRNLGNNNTYRTGLLRDIHKETFRLLPSYEDHDFQQQMDTQVFQGEDVSAASIAGLPENGRYVRFANTDDARQFINSKIDPSFDMVYIRIHGRATGEPTRLHYNLCSNHEVTYAGDDIEGRFMTTTVKDVPMTEKAKTEIQEADQGRRLLH